MKFTKMHGIGNDFVVMNAIEQALDEEQLPRISRQLNDRKFGIGGDGLILVLPSKITQFRMRMFNPDGSESEMCGNGIRCFAKYLYDRKMTTDSAFTIETLAGVKPVWLKVNGGKVESVRVDMGTPLLQRSEIPMRGDGNQPVIGETLRADGRKFEITCVSMGNPHCVIYEEKLETFPVCRYGPQIEHHMAFPKRINVQFVKVCNNSEIVLRTWERGAGETLACGTGACASVVASVLNNRTGKKVLVHLPGGDLLVEWSGDNRVLMTGPAEEVFEGEIPL